MTTHWRKSFNSLKASPVTKAQKFRVFSRARWKISSCDYRHHPVCRGSKSGNTCIHGYRCLCRQADGKSNLSARSKRRYSRISCYAEKKKNVQGCVSQNSDPMNSILRKVEELGLNASAGHTWNSWDASGTTLNSGKKKAIWRHYPKRWTSWAKSLRARFWGTATWGNLTTSRLYQQGSVEFGEKICKLKPNIKLRVILLWRRQRHRSAYVYCVFGSVNAQCWARRFELRYNGYFWEGPEHLRRWWPQMVKFIQTRKHQFLFLISICSQQCNYSSKRQRFYCFVNFAQNADVHMSGKRRNSTIDQNWEDNDLCSGQLSTSRCIKTVIIFQEHFVFNIEINGAV